MVPRILSESKHHRHPGSFVQHFQRSEREDRKRLHRESSTHIDRGNETMKNGAVTFTHDRDTAGFKVFSVNQFNEHSIKLWIPHGKIGSGSFSGYVGEGPADDDPKDLEIKSLREERVRMQNELADLKQTILSIKTTLNRAKL